MKPLFFERARELAVAAAVLTAATLFGACSSCDQRGGLTVDGQPADAPPPADANVDAIPLPDGAPLCPIDQVCGTACCSADQVCFANQCMAAATCASNNDCENDSFCDPVTSLCKPYPAGVTDPTCTHIVQAGTFTAAVQCEWPGPPTGDAFPGHVNVLSTPMVIDFDFDNDAVTIQPSIVFPSYNGTDGGNAADQGNATFFGVIRIIDGPTCTQQYTISVPAVVAAEPVAIGDLDGDGRAEIVASTVGGGVAAWRYDTVSDSWPLYWQTTQTFAAGVSQWSGPSIYDLNNDGFPEVIQGAAVFNGQTGALIDGSLGLRSTAIGQIPVVADLHGDGKPELLAGDTQFKWDSTANGGVGAWAAETVTANGQNGRIAVADFGTFGETAGADDRSTLDGIPEIAVVASGQLRIRTIGGRVIFGPVNLKFFAPATDAGLGGPPTIADFDGDGRVEVGVAGRGGYNIFDIDCQGTPDATSCASLRTDGILWAEQSQDISSSVTGSTVFDFEGDGSAEAVYADECFSRVYDGKTGNVEYSAFRTSCTWYENPVVADVNGDFKSEIVIPSNTNCAEITCPALDPLFDGLLCQADNECPGATTCGFENVGDPIGKCRCTNDNDCGGNGYVCSDPIAGPSPVGQVCRAGHPNTKISGVRVIRDALNRWVDSRPVWNQHAYSVTNVGDDGSIPQTNLWQRNWTTPGYNNFRQAIAGDPSKSISPDLTSHGEDFVCAHDTITLTSKICNRGTEPVGAGEPTSFYLGSPPVGAPVCVTTTDFILQPGDCSELTCVWQSPSNNDAITVTVVVDDDGTGTGDTTECHEGNNSSVLHGTGCGIVQ